MKAPLALLFVAALCTACAGPGGRNAAKAGCPTTAQDLPVEALYGDWQARFDGLPNAALVRLGKHPDYAGVRGTITRTAAAPSARTTVAQLAGDVDDEGELAIDESLDGRSISGVWSGSLQPDSCGREFKGTWRNAADDSTHPFTLKKTEPTRDQ
ncbi:hypothetical protein ASC78_04585 [Variovorax sp. Root318D1]|uniref:hypothetical protein n=1 Tax=Variovorax sp. Root318D1 TaxID=1736513 RepID=UPI0006F75430|nr:hypothetical protein [Variovorax sp. Root318D1]KQU86839.1 hypothetical protein ASC78_04585 [Variovorax sp. Root318D1]